jgi:uncharacterized protein
MKRLMVLLPLPGEGRGGSKARVLACLIVTVLPAVCLASTPAHIDRLRMQADAGRDPQALSALHQIAQNGPPDAQRTLGEVLLRQADGKRANEALEGLAWLKRAADQHDPLAPLLLGKAWLLGAPGLTPDATKARAWFARVNLETHPQAAYYLGLIDKNGYGDGAAANLPRAAAQFKFAAERNVAEAMYQLANAHRHGDGVEADEREAMRWYLRAAALEHPQALQELAQAFARGDTLLPQSELQAENMRRAVEHALRHPKAAP